ncbi:MAG: hypothetical protein ACRD6X_07835 [Pyrinomonadaceae bacterium]
MERSIRQKSRPKSLSDDGSGNGDFYSEGFFADILRLARRIAYGRIPESRTADILDISQEVSLRLWKWREEYEEKSEAMSDKDWNSFAARTTHNEINRYFSLQMKTNEVPLEEAESTPSSAVGGNTDIEIVSMAKELWQGICLLTLYQRRSLLLHSSDLIIYLMVCGIEDTTIADTLGFRGDQWTEMIERLPLNDTEIAKLETESRSHGGRNQKVNARAIKKARFDARKKLKDLVK